VLVREAVELHELNFPYIPPMSDAEDPIQNAMSLQFQTRYSSHPST
jgi:hypothetical protein